MSRLLSHNSSFSGIAGSTIAAFVLFGLLGCGGPEIRNSAPLSPPDAALSAAQLAVAAGLDAASRAEEEVERVSFELRYNPARCDCPQWEFLFRGRWTRAGLQPEEEATLESLLSQGRADEGGGLFPTYSILGTLAPTSIVAETGMRYRVLIVHDWPGGGETVDPSGSHE